MHAPQNPHVVLLCHWPADRAYWLEDLLRDHRLTVQRFSSPWGKSRQQSGPLAGYVSSLRLGWRAARAAARKQGVVVADTTAHMAGVFAAVVPASWSLRRAPALCLNLILYDKPGWRTLARKSLYRLALANKRAMFTVSNGDLRDHYARMLRASPERFTVLPDCYSPGHREFRQHDSSEEEGYVFVGGEAARDWATAMEAARLCPTTQFIFVARERRWKDRSLPDNVELRFDLPLNDFYEVMRRSSLVVVPLNNEIVTAGLIVVTHGALMGCPVLATRTPAVESYYPSESQDLLVPPRDPVALADRISRYEEDPGARDAAAAALRAFVLQNHSPEAYAGAVATRLIPSLCR
jgi:glycosyltransferase involved in cell wall biosynthesis